jgi:hypothetical protein
MGVFDFLNNFKSSNAKPIIGGAGRSTAEKFRGKGSVLPIDSEKVRYNKNSAGSASKVTRPVTQSNTSAAQPTAKPVVSEPVLREAPSIADVYAKIEARNPGWRRPGAATDSTVVKPAVSAADSTVIKPLITDSITMKPVPAAVDSMVTRPLVGDTTTTKAGQPVITTKQPATQQPAQPAAQKPAAQQSEGPSFSDWMRAQVKAGNYNTIQKWNGKEYHIKYGDEAMHNKAMAKLGNRPNVYGRTAEQYRRIEANEDWNGGK